jgi:hypothetical protein
MKGRTKVLLTLAAVILAVGWPLAAHYRAKRKIQDYRRQLQARGERLTVAELIPHLPPEAANSAPALIAAASPLGYGVLTNFPPAMKYIAPGRALVAWKHDILPTADSTNIWPALAAEVARSEDLLSTVRSALEKPSLAFDLDYRAGIHLALSHLPQVKQVAQWLGAAAILDLHEGRMNDAGQNLLALAALVERNKDEPLMISELVRAAIAAIAVAPTWEALQSADWQDEQLREVQAAWESVDWLAQAEAALEMERATGEQLFHEARESYSVLASGGYWTRPNSSGLSELAQMGKETLSDPFQGLSDIARRYPGYWSWKCWQSYEDELAHMEVLQAGIEAVRKARREQVLGPALKQLDQNSALLQQAHPRAGRWLGYSPFDIAGTQKFLARIAAMETQRRLLVTALALKRSRLRHGELPRELMSLVPEFVAQPCRDPMDGKQLRYRLKADGSFLLYSVGENGEDNGGDPAPPQSPSLPSKQWWRGRDAVWPSPATPEEVKADFDKLPLRLMQSGAAAAFRRRYGPLPARPSVTQTNPATISPK